ncbi:MAG: MBL fold metallo-hydrolase [Pseudomonadota bacterium]
MITDVSRNLFWLGHDSFLLMTAGRAVYFDPFQLSENLPPAELILISHEHFDHCSPEDVGKIRRGKTAIVTDRAAAAKLKGNITIVQPGQQITIEGISIETVPSYNTDKKFHPVSAAWLGFIVTVNGVRVYHAGDTDFIPEMKDIRTDIALLPVSGTYVMTAEEAAEAALAIRPALAIPMHYGSIVGTEKDAARFEELLKGKVEVKILKKAKF